jgi:hypothetical protein
MSFLDAFYKVTPSHQSIKINGKGTKRNTFNVAMVRPDLNRKNSYFTSNDSIQEIKKHRL